MTDDRCQMMVKAQSSSGQVSQKQIAVNIKYINVISMVIEIKVSYLSTN